MGERDDEGRNAARLHQVQGLPVGEQERARREDEVRRHDGRAAVHGEPRRRELPAGAEIAGRPGRHLRRRVLLRLRLGPGQLRRRRHARGHRDQGREPDRRRRPRRARPAPPGARERVVHRREGGRAEAVRGLEQRRPGGGREDAVGRGDRRALREDADGVPARLPGEAARRGEGPGDNGVVQEPGSGVVTET